MRHLPSRRFWLAFVPVAAAVAAVVTIVAASGDDDGGGENGAGGPAIPAAPPAPSANERRADPGANGSTGPSDEEQAIGAVHAYVDAIDDRDGARVCSALAPGAIRSFRLPREGAGCAEPMSRSIGYRDPRGYPVFDSARIDAIGNVAIGAGEARVTATVVTEFADRDQPSIEDDLVYLARVDGGWRVARPSAVLYRAVGRPEVPLEALAPG